jgi:hypothetical protein
MKIKRNGAVTALPCCSCDGLLAAHLDGFATLLASKGYAATTVRIKCTLVAGLSRWLMRHKLSLIELDEQRLEQSHAGLRRRDVAQRGDMATTRQMLAFLLTQKSILTHRCRSAYAASRM